MFDRERLETLEAERLAAYGVRSRDNKGRCYPQEESSYRTAFQRDRDRVIHSAAFRRLEYKTQVFVNDMGDDYRTRLTHTLEVAQIGRTIARALGANEDLVEAIALAHDLGHPPFGHAGEDALNGLMRKHSDGSFNHNHQTYRVVTLLEKRSPEYPGLNLTRDALHGIAAHGENDDLKRRLGYDPALRGSLEAQIADASDELAYNAHDLDDGLRACLFIPDDLEPLEVWHQLRDRIRWRGSLMRDGKMDDIARHTFIRELIGLFVDDVLAATASRLRTLNPVSAEAIQQQPDEIVGYTEKVGAMSAALKAFLYENMYYSHRVVRMKQRAARFLEQMFESLLTEPRQMPKMWQEQAETRPLPRVIADYIASMTDRGALLEYRHLFDPETRP